MAKKMDNYEKAEIFIFFLGAMGAIMTFGMFGFWGLMTYLFVLWLGWCGLKKFEKWIDNGIGYDYYAPRDNQDKWDRFFGRGEDDYDPNSYYKKQVEEAYKPECDEDPEVIRIRKEIKSLVKANRLKAQREMELEDIESGHNSSWGR